MQNTQSFYSSHRCAFRTEICKVRCEIGSDSCKIRPCLLNILLSYGDCHILFLCNAVRTGCLIEHNIVALGAIFVEIISFKRHKNGILKIRLVQPVIVHGYLRGSSAVQRIEKLRICQKHTLFILTACHKIVDIRKFECLGKLVPDLENAVRPDAFDRDKVLHLFRHFELFFVLCQYCFNAFYHASSKPPFRVRR